MAAALVLTGVTAIAPVGPADLVSALPADTSAAGRLTLEPDSGGRSTEFFIGFGGTPACPTGAGYRWHTFITPISTDAATLTFDADGAPLDPDTLVLRDIGTNPVVGQGPAMSNPIPPSFSFVSATFDALATGDYWVGVACALVDQPVNQTERFWQKAISFDADDGYNQDADRPVELTVLGLNDFHGRIDGVLTDPAAPTCSTAPNFGLKEPATNENALTTRFATNIEQLRAAGGAGNTLVVAGGDLIGASLFNSAAAGDPAFSDPDSPAIDVMSELIDVSSVGNHEFDLGFADLVNRVIPRAEYPYLGANVRNASDGSPALDEYALFERGGITIGVIGAVTGETPTLVSPEGVADLTFTDPVDAVNLVATMLSNGTDNGTTDREADVIIAAYHEGGAGATLGAAMSNATFAHIANDTHPAVGAIITAHTHQPYTFSAPIPGGGTRPIVQTGEYAARVAEVVLTVDSSTGDVLAHSQRNVDTSTAVNLTVGNPLTIAEATDDYPRVAAVAEIVCNALAEAFVAGNPVLGEVTGDITTAFTGGDYTGPGSTYTGPTRDDRRSESTLGNLTANYLLDSLDEPDPEVPAIELFGVAEIGVINPGGLRAELRYALTAPIEGEDGLVRVAEANSVLPFANNLNLITLTGAQFKTLLEQQWQRTAWPGGSIPSRPYLQLGLSDNVTYTYDPAAALGAHITSITIDGAPYDPAASYRIATFSFLTAGGDNFIEFRNGTNLVDTGKVDRDYWFDYITANSPLSPSFARQSTIVTPMPTTVERGADLEFTVGEADTAVAPEGPFNRTLDLRSLGSPRNTSLDVLLEGESIGTATVTNGIAAVDVTVPADTTSGAKTLELVATPSGTTITLSVEVLTEPGAPTGVTAVRGDAAATVTWVAPADDGGSPITGYTVTSDPGGEQCTTDGTELSCTVTGLTNGEPYTFTVFATNDVGDSAASAASNSVTPAAPTAPDAPTGVNAAAGNAAATVSWTAPADDGGSPILSYTATASPGGATCTTDDATDLACTVPGLTNGVAYTFTVRATNAAGTGAASAPSAAVTPQAPATAPGAPSGVVAVAGDAAATVSWAAPADNGGSPITGYVVTAAPGGQTCVTTGALSCSVTGLSNGVEYTFTVSATNAIGTSPASAPSAPVTPTAPVTPPPPLIETVVPSRLFDTRPAEPQWAIEVDKSTIGGDDDILQVNVLGAAGIPTEGVGAVSLNVTAVDPVANGYLTVFTCGQRPTVSSVNYFGVPGAYPNAVITPVGPDGELCFYSKEAAHLVVDVNGWFPEGGDLGIIEATRLFDTRAAEPQWAVAVDKSTIGGDDDVLQVNVLGAAGVPEDGVGAVSINVTAVNPAANGYITVYTCGVRPTVSSVNYVGGAGATPNAVIAPLSPDGDLCFYSLADTDLVVDINAWFPDDGALGVVEPARVLDTRAAEPQWAVEVPKQQIGGEANVLQVDFDGVAGLPDEGVGAVSLNVTAVNPEANGYITVYTCGERPTVSSVNYLGVPGAYPNAVIAPVGPDGEVCFFSLADTDLVVDINGWFPAAPAG